MSSHTNLNQEQSNDGTKAEPVVRLLRLLRSGSIQFGIFADEITAVAPWREPAPLPHAPKTVLGVVSIQGRMLTVLDMAGLAGEDLPDDRPGQHLIALRGEEQLALAIEQLGETIEVSEADLKAPRNFASPLVLAVVHRADAEVKILNVKELFPAAIQGRERRRRRF